MARLLGWHFCWQVGYQQRRQLLECCRSSLLLLKVRIPLDGNFLFILPSIAVWFVTSANGRIDTYLLENGKRQWTCHIGACYSETAVMLLHFPRSEGSTCQFQPSGKECWFARFFIFTSTIARFYYHTYPPFFTLPCSYLDIYCH